MAAVAIIKILKSGGLPIALEKELMFN